MSILYILNLIENESSTNEKIFIAKDYSNNNLFKDVVEAALNPRIKYFMKQLPDYEERYDPDYSLVQALDMLKSLSLREVSGNNALNLVSNTLSKLSRDDVEVLKRIILKDLKCGLGKTMANKVWNKLLPEYKVMLAQPNKEKTMKNINFPCGSQLKSDGMRANIHYDEEITGVYSRNGNEFPKELFKVFEYEVRQIASHQSSGLDQNLKIVLDGEFRVLDENGDLLDRKTGNGILNSVQQNTDISKDIDLNRIIFIVWDYTSIDEFYIGKSFSHNIYESRFDFLTSVINIEKSSGQFKNIFLIEHRIVNNIVEADNHFKEMRERGEEGTILKNMNSPWVNKRSNDLVKMKAVEDADLIITSVNIGTGKNSERLGSFTLESKCGKLISNVGTGFSDEQRQNFWDMRYELLGKICEVKYNEIISDRKKDTKSLFLPVFIEIRDDKDTANSLLELN